MSLALRKSSERGAMPSKSLSSGGNSGLDGEAVLLPDKNPDGKRTRRENRADGGSIKAAPE